MDEPRRSTKKVSYEEDTVIIEEYEFEEELLCALADYHPYDLGFGGIVVHDFNARKAGEERGLITRNARGACAGTDKLRNILKSLGIEWEGCSD